MPALTEKDLIAGIRSRAGRSHSKSILTFGIGDDCAVLKPRSGQDMVVTTDLSLEKVHFRRDWHSPESVGHRCLARGLSDLAAMGAKPESAFLSIALPKGLTGSWMDRFCDGFFALAEKNQVPLAGGDTSSSPNGLVIADIVLIGSVPRGKALLRSGAHPGDVIYVTGALGGSAAELLSLARRHKPQQTRHPHLYPEPRLAAGRALTRRRLATAAIDVSDGLSTDLAHICEESSLAAEVDAAALPVEAGATLEQALHGGEDYELLFTASPGTAMPKSLGGVAIHAIGRMKKRGKAPRVTLLRDGERLPLTAGGWEHFRS
jgi:thiamine-monophosphate kinase